MREDKRSLIMAFSFFLFTSDLTLPVNLVSKISK